VKEAFEEPSLAKSDRSFSVIVCTRNGQARILDCLASLQHLRGPKYEIVVVDDGSTDDTSALVRKHFPDVKLVELAASGLSAARNAGAKAATGDVLAFTDDDCEADPDWLAGLASCFADGWDAAGGPNLPPGPTNSTEAIVAAAPGAASHVMLDDCEAEHVPGCNLAVTRSVFFEIGGFDPDFRTAGDDVDFCWRLRDADKRIGFAPTAFVWHHRRPSMRSYLRQQIGYGHAEAMLMRKHPSRFSPSGDARWHGMIYTGAPVRVAGAATIYHGPMGLAGYQGVNVHMQPLRDLPKEYSRPWNRLLLGLITWLAPRLRSRARIGRFRGPVTARPSKISSADSECAVWSDHGREEELDRLLAEGWSPGGPSDPWDLELDGTRVLIACERHRKGKARLLYRVWGNSEKLTGLDDAEPI
jgi:GT2 family glycosyltransferase